MPVHSRPAAPGRAPPLAQAWIALIDRPPRRLLGEAPVPGAVRLRSLRPPLLCASEATPGKWVRRSRSHASARRGALGKRPFRFSTHSHRSELAPFGSRRLAIWCGPRSGRSGKSSERSRSPLACLLARVWPYADHLSPRHANCGGLLAHQGPAGRCSCIVADIRQPLPQLKAGSSAYSFASG